jgi:hypothetical protein
MKKPPKFTLGKSEARKYIEHEDNLVNHRMSWLMSSQAFLFGAFVILINGPIFSTDARTDDFKDIATALLYFIPLAGITISFCSGVGVYAAFNAINYWKECVAPVEKRREVTSEAGIAYAGGVASAIPAPMFISFWFLLLIYSWSTWRSASWFLLLPPPFVALIFGGYWARNFWHIKEKD